jgi:hypothetical protein
MKNVIGWAGIVPGLSRLKLTALVTIQRIDTHGFL